MTMIAADKNYLVVGLGLTGLSCVRYLRSQNKVVSVIDSRMNPPGLAEVQQEFPDLEVICGSFDQTVLNSASVLVMSPGVPLSTPEIVKARENGVAITSDIELFLQAFNGRVVAITGSNAKSTVTQWLGEALRLGGYKTLVAGNIGLPVLSALSDEYDIAVLELSSFQLELLPKTHADVATILNVSEDHMDRYDGMPQYQQAKQRVYFGAKHVVFNRQDMLTAPLTSNKTKVTSFGLNSPDLRDFGVMDEGGIEYVCQGAKPILACDEIALPGRHNVANALAVLAMAAALDNPLDATIQALKSFKGLPHRCQLIAEKEGVRYFNDSKATNVGSTIAALSGLADKQRKNIVLLLGGQSKGQDLTPLIEPVTSSARQVYAFGEDRHLFKAILPQCQLFDTLEQALHAAKEVAATDDVVLLSPACASFDQFKNFEHRGECFVQWVEGVR